MDALLWVVVGELSVVAVEQSWGRVDQVPMVQVARHLARFLDALECSVLEQLVDEDARGAVVELLVVVVEIAVIVSLVKLASVVMADGKSVAMLDLDDVVVVDVVVDFEY